jgi:hypothetical protein
MYIEHSKLDIMYMKRDRHAEKEVRRKEKGKEKFSTE